MNVLQIISNRQQWRGKQAWLNEWLKIEKKKHGSYLFK